MTKSTFFDIIEKLDQQCNETLSFKGRSYSDQIDMLSNFKKVGESIGTSPYQTWGVYFNKHVFSINNAIKAEKERGKITDPSENINGRIIDAINYLKILACMLQEDNNQYIGEDQ